MLVLLPEGIVMLLSLVLLVTGILVLNSPVQVVDIALDKIMVELTPFSKLGGISGPISLAPPSFELAFVNFVLQDLPSVIVF